MTFMKETHLKSIKILLLSLTSWFIYFWIINSNVIENFSKKLERVNSNKGFGILTFMYLAKYFLLLFGIISITFLVINFLNKK